MAKFIRASALKIGNRIRFDSKKTYIVKTIESLAESHRPLLNRINFGLVVEGAESGICFTATFYAGDQIEIVE